MTGPTAGDGLGSTPTASASPPLAAGPPERIDSDGGMPTTGLKVETLGTPTLDSNARDLRVRPDGIVAPAIQERE